MIDNLFNDCYIINADEYDDKHGIKIYNTKGEIKKKINYDNYIYYIVRIYNYEFSIAIYHDNIKNYYERKAFIIDSNDKGIGETNIILSFSKEEILKYYELKLHNIKEILENKKIQLNKSLVIIEEQKHVLYNYPEKLFLKV